MPTNILLDGSGKQKVAVCYKESLSPRDVVNAEAAKLCREPGSSVQFLSGDYYLNDCPLLKKQRAIFACIEPR